VLASVTEAPSRASSAQLPAGDDADRQPHLVVRRHRDAAWLCRISLRGAGRTPGARDLVAPAER
jgi:hypothetical protein